MHPALKGLFEEQVSFRMEDGTLIEGSVFIGETEFLPVEILREDPEAYKSEFESWLNDTWLPTQAERRDRILKLHGNAKRYVDLCHAIRRRQVVPLVGSGMSVPSGCPTWSTLLRKIKEFTKIDSDKLEILLEAFAFEEAADLLASGTNPNLLNERIEHDLRIDDPKLISGAVRILPAIFPNFVVTTNFDDLLEQLYLRSGTPFLHVLAGGELARYRQIKNPADRFLLKLHGDCRRPGSRVLLSTEYDKAYGPGEVNREELALLYRVNSLLFVGCSVGPDRTIQLISEVSKMDRIMPKHYAFLQIPASDQTRGCRQLSQIRMATN